MASSLNACSFYLGDMHWYYSKSLSYDTHFGLIPLTLDLGEEQLSPARPPDIVAIYGINGHAYKNLDG